MRRGVVVCGAVAVVVVATACGSTTSSHPTAWAYQPPAKPVTSVFDEATMSPRACDGWLRGTLVGICDPTGLQQAFAGHTLNDKGDVEVTLSGRELSGGGNSVLAQFRGAGGTGLGVQPGQTVTISGHVSSGAYLYIRADSRTSKVYASGEALFDQLGLGDGGVATVQVALEHDHLHYTLTGGDGATKAPVATGGVGGPGSAIPIPSPPPGYADTPAQLARTYVAAVNARDGQTICSLFAGALRHRYSTFDPHMPCWAFVGAYIDFTGENADREFKSMLLTKVGARRTATAGDHDYVGLPLTLDVRFRAAAGASPIAHPQLRQSFDDVLWVEQQDGAWRIVKPSLALLAAGYIGRGREVDPLAAPTR